MQAIFETLFDIVYLVSVIILGVLMIRGSKGRRQYFLYGMMAIFFTAVRGQGRINHFGFYGLQWL